MQPIDEPTPSEPADAMAGVEPPEARPEIGDTAEAIPDTIDSDIREQAATEDTTSVVDKTADAADVERPPEAVKEAISSPREHSPVAENEGEVLTVPSEEPGASTAPLQATAASRLPVDAAEKLRSQWQGLHGAADGLELAERFTVVSISYRRWAVPYASYLL